MTPCHRLLTASLSALMAIGGQAAAQTASAPTRGDIAAEARAAVRRGTTADGEIVGSAASSSRAASDRSRGEVKGEAKAAVTGGGTLRGEAGYRGPQKATADASGRSRAQVRQEARATARQGDATVREAASYGGPAKAKGADR